MSTRISIDLNWYVAYLARQTKSMLDRPDYPSHLDPLFHAIVFGRSGAQLITNLSHFKSFDSLSSFGSPLLIGWVGVLLGLWGMVAWYYGSRPGRVFSSIFAGAYAAMFSYVFASTGNWSASVFTSGVVVAFAISVVQLGRRAW